MASLLLLAGALGDRFGRRGALLAGIALFGMGSLLSGLAHSGGQLVAFRALTGLGGALIMPGTLSTITSVFPPEERARGVGIWAGFAGAGGTLGMLAAGWMLGTFSWPSIFYAPAALSALTFVAILAFVVWELRVDHPLLDPRLFRYRGFAVGSASLLVLFVALFGLFLVILQYLQLLLGYSALKSAVALLPLTFLMIPISTLAAPLSERYGMRLVSGVGLAVTAAGMVAFGPIERGWPE